MKKLTLLIVVLCAVTAASAEVVIFDDAFRNGWSAASWDMMMSATGGIGESIALSSRSLSGSVSEIRLRYTGGTDITANSTLEFWINSDGSVVPASGIQVGINWEGSGADAPFFFDTRNFSDRTYYLDGVPTLIANMKTDANGSTWQKVAVDLTEDLWVGWPYALVEQELTKVNMISIKLTSASDKLLVDNVKLVPEPATLSVLGLGALALIRRRRN